MMNQVQCRRKIYLMLTSFTWSENSMTRKFSSNFHTSTDFAKVEKKKKNP